MLLGKRRRDPMKRTTSMTIIDLDLDDTEPFDSNRDSVMNLVEETALPMPSWCNHKSSSGGQNMVMEVAPFLRTCGLCNRRLRPSRDDIFMYRGNIAFCSLECRDQQMKHDERKEKCSIADNLMKAEMITTTTTTLQRPMPPQSPPSSSKTSAWGVLCSAFTV